MSEVGDWVKESVVYSRIGGCASQGGSVRGSSASEVHLYTPRASRRLWIVMWRHTKEFGMDRGK